jgi:hypothetical protein
MLITSVGLFEQRRPTRADGCDLNSHICKVAVPSTDAFKVLVGLQLLSLNRCLQRNATDLGRAKSLGSGASCAAKLLPRTIRSLVVTPKGTQGAARVRTSLGTQDQPALAAAAPELITCPLVERSSV